MNVYGGSLGMHCYRHGNHHFAKCKNRKAIEVDYNCFPVLIPNGLQEATVVFVPFRLLQRRVPVQRLPWWYHQGRWSEERREPSLN